MKLGRWAISCLTAAAAGSAAVAVPVMAATGPATARHESITTLTSTTTTMPGTPTTTTGPSTPTATAGSPAVPIRVGFKGSDAVLVLGWKFAGDVSVVTSVHIMGVQENATLSVACRGSSCPARVTRHGKQRVSVHRTLRAGGRQLHRFIDNLLKLRFQAGDRVVFTIKVPGKPGASSEAVVRNGRRPVARRLG